ncbi:sugar phosphate isomerase/epimerase family protein [Enterocloster citroniae]
MSFFSDYVCFGISPSMLYPLSFEDELEHFSAVDQCCQFPEYECFETFLPSDAGLRKAEIKRMKEHNKVLNYNTPGYFQLDGKYNASSDDPSFRQHALAAMKEQIDYASEAGCSLIVLTGTPDQGDSRRPVLLERYSEFFLKCAAHAAQYNMTVTIEPIERGCFKNLILGPMCECAAFIKDMQEKGAFNAKLILDIAHLPLMGEDIGGAVKHCMEAGLAHVHMGNAVLEPASRFYGHTHPPIGVQHGCYDCQELILQFKTLLASGYIPTVPGPVRPTISLEVRPYPGVSGRTSARVMYEKVSSAFMAALDQYCNC